MEQEEEQTEKAKISKDEQFFLASGLYKCCRLGYASEAVKFAEKLKRGTSPYYVLRILTQLVGEDLSNKEYIRLVPAVRTLYEASKSKDLRAHDIWQMTFAIAKATKWFQDKNSIELERIRHQVNSKNKEIKVIDADFLYDAHTREGIRRIKTGQADLRMSGKWEYRFKILERWQLFCEENKGLSPEELKDKWISMHCKEEEKNGKEQRKLGAGAESFEAESKTAQGTAKGECDKKARD